MDFVVFVHELGEDFSVVSEVVYQVQECFAVSVQEDFTFYLFQLVVAREHLLEDRPLAESEDVSLGHQVVRATHVQRNYLTVQVNQFSHLSLVFFPVQALLVDKVILFIEFALHVDIPLGQEVVVLLDLPVDVIELDCLLLEFHIHALDVFLEGPLNVIHS